MVKDFFVNQHPQLLHPLVLAIGLVIELSCVNSIDAQDADLKTLPFHRDEINRYSLDHLPRSLSIRQGEDLWLGYDLERAKLYKLWQSPANASGLEKRDFVVRSVGVSWYEDKSDEGWQLQRYEKMLPVDTRYRGCSQHSTYFELTWDLNCEGNTLRLFERIPRLNSPNAIRAARELRVDGLVSPDTLFPPSPAGSAWKLTKMDGTTCSSLIDGEWYRMILPWRDLP